MRNAVCFCLFLFAFPVGQSSVERRFAQVKARDYVGGCLEGILSPSTQPTVSAAVRAYRESRGLASVETATAILVALVEYETEPTRRTFDRLVAAHRRAGNHASVAEDVCRCAYYEHGEYSDPPQIAARLIASVSPVAVGAYWAGRRLHERDQEAEALEYYERALSADSRNPRTRIFYAIALLNEQRPAEALKMLEPIPDDWARHTVNYWRARALLDVGRPGDARAVLQALPPTWVPEPTVPDASTDAGPVQPSRRPGCMIGQTFMVDGDLRAARAMLEKPAASYLERCDPELGRLELKEGRPFEALVALESDRHRYWDIRAQALAALNSCAWARSELEYLDGSRFNTLRSEVTAKCPVREPDRNVPIAPVLTARLDAPRLTLFTEHAMPSQWQWKGERTDDWPDTKAYPNLDATIVALSPVADRMFAVAVAHDLDPRGEVSLGGYWLHLSSDRGRTWTGPYYLGFAHQFPYVVPSVSRLPPFNGDRLQLEVERREVDESSITFPPVALRAKSVGKHRYLSIDLAALRRDSDGDGLTDPAEEKLLLDPRSADTEGDGVNDADDPLPLQPRARDGTDRVTQLMTQLVSVLFGGPPHVQQSAAAGGESSSMTGQPDPFGARPTLFVEADECPFGHNMPVRAICLAPQAFDRYRAKFGVTYPMEMAEIAFDPNKERALIRYSFRWRGGTLLATWKNGAWELKLLTSWIT